MKSLINFINESQSDSKSAIDEIMRNIKAWNFARFIPVCYANDKDGNYRPWSPIKYSIVRKDSNEMVIFSFCCEKKQPILDELGELVGKKPNYNDDEDYASIKIDGENIIERSQKVLEWISKNIKKLNFYNDAYISMNREDAEKYYLSKTSFTKKSFEDQMKDLDDQIKSLQEQKTQLQDLQDFLKELEKE